MKYKSFFEIHGKNIDKEVEEFEAYEEKTKIEFQKCEHKNIDFVDTELRCNNCGNAWHGTASELVELARLLK